MILLNVENLSKHDIEGNGWNGPSKCRSVDLEYKKLA